jgi:SAM-dependent methyltransferase
MIRASLSVATHVARLAACKSTNVVRTTLSRNAWESTISPSLEGFVLAVLPPPPASVLEVGCGAGKLARAMDEAGHRVLAVDPEAPAGPIFRRAKLEELELDPGSFGAAVATYSLHHVDELTQALDSIAGLLEPHGRLVIEEFGWDLLDLPTAEWYRQQQGASSVESVLGDWRAEHEGLHGYSELRQALDERFAEHSFEWRPYLFRCLERDDLERGERAAIERDAIRAVGFRYVGTRR